MNDKTVLGVAAILGAVALEGIALLAHADGAYMGPVIALIGGIAGYSLAQQESIKVLAASATPCPDKPAPMPTAA
jgi:hypothetical protein